MNPLRVDNTKRRCARDCMQKYYWEHVRGIKPRKGSNALRYGVVWHAAMDAYYSDIAERGWVRDGRALQIAVLTASAEWEEYTSKQNFYEDYRTLPNLVNAFMQYVNHFAFDEGILEILASEVLFELEMYPETDDECAVFSNCPETEPVPNYFIFTGIIDLELKVSDQPWINDHKTTGMGIQQVAATLRRSPQFIGYTYASHKKLAVIPAGFLTTIHHLSAYKSRTTGNYGKIKVDFDRVPEIYTDADFTNWRLAFFKTVNDLHLAYHTDIWPMNLDSCYNYGLCSFAELCDQLSVRPKEDVILDNFIIGDIWDVVAETKKRQERRQTLLDKIAGGK